MGTLCAQNNSAYRRAVERGSLRHKTFNRHTTFGKGSMQSSLSWIEWLDRLDRVLSGAREDVRALASFDDPQALAVVERCKRQLTALTDDLRLLDRRGLSTKPGAANTDRAGKLQKALHTTVFHLGTAVKAPVADSRSARERLLGTIDSALRDSCYEAAMLLGPVRLRA